MSMPRFVARQPILDRAEKVYGFELLFRPGEREIWPPDNCASGGATECMPDLDAIKEITEGARAFVKCPRTVLLNGSAVRLPRDSVVLEIPASLQPDERVVAACRSLRDAGFALALEDYNSEWHESLATLVQIIKLDVTASTDRAQWLLIRKFQARGMMFVANRVDTRAQFQVAAQQGFSHFQGHFYLRPQPHAGAEVTPTKMVYFRVLQLVTQPEIDVDALADTIKHDLALSYKLLRFLNSAWFAFRSQVKSIRHALLLLGEREVRKWIGLISVAALGEGAPSILVSSSLIRAAFCESLAPLVGATKRQADYFFLGLLSSIDILMGRPMRAMLAELPVTPDVSAALLGEQNPLRDALQTVLDYEQGNWEGFSNLVRKLGQQDETLCELYFKALQWSHELAKVQDKKATVPATH